jgi:ubiquinone/menaquinone biosynthesis C-methylase UbiE
MRRGLERYAPAKGYDVGPLARQRYASMVVQKAGLFPGDRVLDVETGTGILGVQVARAFTRSKVVATDADRANLERARANADAEKCRERIDFVQALPEALPFKDETFFFATVGLELSRQDEPLDALEEIHRVGGYTCKVYAPSLDFTGAAKKPRGTARWVFDDAAMEALRGIGFGKLVKLRVMMLPDGAQLYLVTMKRFDPEGDDEPEDGET